MAQNPVQAPPFLVEEATINIPPNIPKETDFITWTKLPVQLFGWDVALKKVLPPFMFLKPFVKHWFVAGGFLRDWIAKKPPKDVDIFFNSVEGCTAVLDEWKALDVNDEWRIVFESKWAVTFEPLGYSKVFFNLSCPIHWSDGKDYPLPQVQLIINPRVIVDPVTVLLEFDFFCCMMAYDPANEKTFTNTNAMLQAERKSVVANESDELSDPIRSLKRALSLRKRGWYIGVESCIVPLIDKIVGKRERMARFENKDDVHRVFYTNEETEVPEGKKVIHLMDLLTPFEIVLMRKQRLDDLFAVELK